MTLQEAIAEVSRMNREAGEFLQCDFTSRFAWTPKAAETYATILNAVASGKLVPKADADLAVAMAEVEKLAAALTFYADEAGWNQPPVQTREGLLSVEYENQASKIRKDRGKVARAALSAYEGSKG